MQGIKYRVIRSPLSQIRMIDAIEHQLKFVGKANCEYASEQDCIRSKLHHYAGEMEHMGDAEAVIKTMIHFMFREDSDGQD